MIKLPEPVAHGIFDSEGFYEAALDKASAERFCAHYNARKDGPLKPFTTQPLITADQLKQAIRDALDAADDLMFDIKGCKVTRFDAQTVIRKLKEDIQ